jgi:hypothetical protein
VPRVERGVLRTKIFVVFYVCLLAFSAPFAMHTSCFMTKQEEHISDKEKEKVSREKNCGKEEIVLTQ